MISIEDFKSSDHTDSESIESPVKIRGVIGDSEEKLSKLLS